MKGEVLEAEEPVARFGIMQQLKYYEWVTTRTQCGCYARGSLQNIQMAVTQDGGKFHSHLPN